MNTQQQLQQALALTQAMLEHANAEQWQQIEVIQQQRDAILSQVFPLNPETATAETTALLQSLLQHNQQVEHICESAKKDLQIQLSGLNKNKKAVAAYQAR